MPNMTVASCHLREGYFVSVATGCRCHSEGCGFSVGTPVRLKVVAGKMCFSLTLCSFCLKCFKGEVLCETTTCVCLNEHTASSNFDVLQVVFVEESRVTEFSE